MVGYKFNVQVMRSASVLECTVYAHSLEKAIELAEKYLKGIATHVRCDALGINRDLGHLEAI